MTREIVSLQVFVRGLRIDAAIGLNPDERGRRQPLVIDAVATLDPGAPRRLRDTFNYEHVVAAARLVADSGHIELAETFALAGLICTSPCFSRAWAWVRERCKAAARKTSSR